eukprot:gene4199-5972_t
MKVKLLLVIASLLFICISAQIEQYRAKRKKKHNQVNRQQDNSLDTATVHGSPTIDETDQNIASSDNITKVEEFKDASVDIKFKVNEKCPICENDVNFFKQAILNYWNDDLLGTYACLCWHLKTSPNDKVAQSILFSLHKNKHFSLPEYGINLIKTMKFEEQKSAKVIKEWEILGPINVGKLEIDADPTFYDSRNNFDIAQNILRMPSNASVYSDLMINSIINWNKVKAKPTGEVDVHFSTSWNDLAQGLSSSSVFEFQAWVRGITFISSPGAYVVNCIGMHTVYIRNDNITHVLVGDVYRGGVIKASIELKIGLVGITIPLRGVGQSSFYCQLLPVSKEQSIAVSPIENIPNPVIFNNHLNGRGVVLSLLFSIPIQNLLNIPVTIDFQLEKPMGEKEDLIIRPATSHGKTQLPSKTLISPGQTLYVALEIVQSHVETFSTNELKKSSKSKGKVEYDIGVNGDTGSNRLDQHETNRLFTLPCRANNIFIITVIPSRGSTVNTNIEFPCRQHSQSFLVSYLDHDESVTQAAVLFPIDPKVLNNNFYNSLSTSMKYDDNKQDSHDHHLNYPVLLSLHGSGITAMSHADAHKIMPKGKKDYIFGIEKYWLIAPTRFGAHNWEGVGELAARRSVNSIMKMFDSIHLNLPKIDVSKPLILSGHSMGGHGVWVAGGNDPDAFNCILPTAGWIKKEEYNNANAFFSLDVSNSFIDPLMKSLLELSMGEYHMDHYVTNYMYYDVHIRVGHVDHTTHPWYSRRMYRLLAQQQRSVVHSYNNSYYNLNSVVRLEEVAGKGHWWWDTTHDNDGGVMNDKTMRDMYHRCHSKLTEQMKINYYYNDFISNYSKITGITTMNNTSNGLMNEFNDWLHKQYSLNEDDPMPVKQTKSNNNNNNNNKIKKDHLQTHEGVHHLLTNRKCHGNITLTLKNPATHAGYCGIRILQQYRILSTSRVTIECYYNHHIIRVKEGGSQFINNMNKTCHIITNNVKRFYFAIHFDSILFGMSTLYINNKLISVIDDLTYETQEIKTTSDSIRQNPFINNAKYYHICFDMTSNHHPVSCQSSFIHSLTEKSLYNYGPLRLIYNRPFVIVYGTPSHQQLRIAMRNFAVYFGNLCFSASRIQVKIMSDLEYLQWIAMISPHHNHNYHYSPNIIFVGNTISNKAMRASLAVTDSSSFNNNNVVLKGRLPGNISFSEDRNNNNNNNDNNHHARFELNQHHFDRSDHGIIFTFPLLYDSSSSFSHGAMGVCIHGNSPQSYLHLSRAVWPVIPPMVRSPFSNYLPDFIVINNRIWSHGFGGVVMAGYWDTDWTFDPSQTFVNYDHIHAHGDGQS